MPPDIPYIKNPEHLQNSNTDLKLALPTLHPWVFSDIKHSNRKKWIALLCWCWREESVRRTHSRAATVNRSMTRRRMGTYQSSYTKFLPPQMDASTPRPEMNPLSLKPWFFGSNTETGGSESSSFQVLPRSTHGNRAHVSNDAIGEVWANHSAPICRVNKSTRAYWLHGFCRRGLGGPACTSTAQVVTQSRLRQLSLSGVLNYFCWIWTEFVRKSLDCYMIA